MKIWSVFDEDFTRNIYTCEHVLPGESCWPVAEALVWQGTKLNAHNAAAA